ncbi:MAG: glycosyltransferase family protein [Deltaproteobacteria bacterium]|nr:glycosyltransferase family protein [Deltaproteobacteria bacterium]
MKTGCIIQTRMTSSRLPGKVLLPLLVNDSKTVLEHVITRIKKAKKIDDVIIATTTNDTDLPIVEFCENHSVKYFRGSEDNVLSRYYQTAKAYNLSKIVRVTSDCPCVDWNVLDELITLHENEKNDYTSNTLERTFPHGIDAEVFDFEILEEAYLNANQKYETEHVTPYIYKTHPDNFKIGQLKADEKRYGPEIRITLDTREDYTLLQGVFDLLASEFTTVDIIKLFTEKPWLRGINSRIVQKKVLGTLDEELEECISLCKTQDLLKAAKFITEAR